MAERRMFAKTIIDSDAFLDMPLSAQALYFHLSMRADDDGFINNAKKIQRMVGASDDDCKLLLAKRFIIAFESGVIVIKHWRIHNYIQKDRYKPTLYTEEMKHLEVNEIGGYTLLDTECIQNGYRVYTQDRIGKESKEEDIHSFSLSQKRYRNRRKQLTESCQENVIDMSMTVNTQKKNEEEEKEEEFHSFAPETARKALGGIGKNVVMLSDDQIEDLLSKLTIEEFNKYVEIVAECELSGKSFKRKTHYQAILDMAIKDRKVEKK